MASATWRRSWRSWFAASDFPFVSDVIMLFVTSLSGGDTPEDAASRWGFAPLSVPDDNRPRKPPLRDAFELRPDVRRLLNDATIGTLVEIAASTVLREETPPVLYAGSRRLIGVGPTARAANTSKATVSCGLQCACGSTSVAANRGSLDKGVMSDTIGPCCGDPLRSVGLSASNLA